MVSLHDADFIYSAQEISNGRGRRQDRCRRTALHRSEGRPTHTVGKGKGHAFDAFTSVSLVTGTGYYPRNSPLGRSHTTEYSVRNTCSTWSLWIRQGIHRLRSRDVLSKSSLSNPTHLFSKTFPTSDVFSGGVWLVGTWCGP